LLLLLCGLQGAEQLARPLLLLQRRHARHSSNDVTSNALHCLDVALQVLERLRDRCCQFNDDMQGTAAVKLTSTVLRLCCATAEGC
jgi:hypothetical protein